MEKGYTFRWIPRRLLPIDVFRLQFSERQQIFTADIENDSGISSLAKDTGGQDTERNVLQTNICEVLIFIVHVRE